MTDDDVVLWYSEQRLTPQALARMGRPNPKPSRVGWALAAALVVGFGLGAWAVWRGPEPLVATPRTWAEAMPIPPEPVVAPRPLEIPAGMMRTEVSFADGAALSGFLNPGNYVDVLVTNQSPHGPLTHTLAQAVFVVEVLRPGRIALLTTPDQDRMFTDAAAHGEIVLDIRNDLDVSYASITGVNTDDLRRQLDQTRASLGMAPTWPDPKAQAGSPQVQVQRTSTHPWSTFAMDVDTASYTLSRAEVDRGHRPDAVRIRVEEFVNALPYDYPVPESGLFSASFEVAPSPWTEDYDLVRVGLRAKVPAARDPVHLTLLVDASCSMSAQLDLVQRSLGTLVDALDPTDTVSLVRFSDQATVLLAPTAAHDPAVRTAISGLWVNGSTALDAGLVAAYTLAATELGSPGGHRVVLCTDGMPNVGRTAADALSAEVRPWTDQGIALTALGFGREGYRDELLEAFADAADGSYAYLDTVDEARAMLADRVVHTVVARDAKIQVTWDPDAVVGWRLIGYDDRGLAAAQFRDDGADGGEVGAGQEVTALYEVRRTGRAGPLGTLTVRAVPGSGAPTEQAFAIPGEAFSTLDQASADTRIAAAAASVALYLADSPISRLDPGRIFAMAQSARRADHAADDAGLLGTIREASTATVVPPRQCHEFKMIAGNSTKVILVDQNGIPCE